MSIFRRASRDQEPVRSIFGCLEYRDPEYATIPQVIVTNAMNSRIEEVEEQLQQEAAEERRRALDEGNTMTETYLSPADGERWQEANATVHREMATLVEWENQGLFPPGVFTTLFLPPWMVFGSNAHLTPGFTTQAVTRALRSSGYDSIGDIAPPTEAVTLYRGGRWLAPHGISWTPNRRYASMYAVSAQYAYGNGVVLSAQVAPHDVLAIIDRQHRCYGREWQYSEYPIDPANVRCEIEGAALNPGIIGGAITELQTMIPFAGEGMRGALHMQLARVRSLAQVHGVTAVLPREPSPQPCH